MSEDMLRIAVLSDIHGYSKGQLQEGDFIPSFVETSAPSDQPGRNPFVALAALVEDESLKADMVVCCGDLGDKADPAAISYVWDQLKGVKAALGAESLLVTPGNHDMDSRHKYNDFDARSTLQGLSDFPFSDENLNNEYWARNVVVVETEDARFAILNSSAFHGYEDEHQHGRISSRTLAYLKSRLEATAEKKINILVCHHHVYKIGSIDLDDYSAMKDGQTLTELLGGGQHGQWLILHGHRHWPSLSYAPGNAGAPTVFSAGSFSASLYPELATKVRNQFYLLDIPKQQVAGELNGRFKAWDFVSDLGFQPAQSRSGLPHVGGFGKRLNGTQVASAIELALHGKKSMDWDELEDSVPDVRYLLPEDLSFCKDRLRDNHGIQILEVDGVPVQVGWKKGVQ